jgi:hypothetical protein
MGQTKHDQIANRIAKKEGTTYNEGQGLDVRSSKRVIEVATHDGDLKDSMRQLQGFDKPRYLATTPDLSPAPCTGSSSWTNLETFACR